MTPYPDSPYSEASTTLSAESGSGNSSNDLTAASTASSPPHSGRGSALFEVPSAGRNSSLDEAYVNGLEPVPSQIVGTSGNRLVDPSGLDDYFTVLRKSTKTKNGELPGPNRQTQIVTPVGPTMEGGNAEIGSMLPKKGWVTPGKHQTNVKGNDDFVEREGSTPLQSPTNSAASTKKLSSAREASNHHPSYDDPVYPFGCAYDGCWATFKRYIDLHRHMAEHYEDNSESTCPHVDCKKVLVSSYSLLRHLEKQGHFTCPNGGCLWKFKTEKEVEVHLRAYGHG